MYVRYVSLEFLLPRIREHLVTKEKALLSCVEKFKGY